MKTDYRNSGLSTVQAVEEIRQQVRDRCQKLHLPAKFGDRLCDAMLLMQIYCDGEDCGKDTMTTGKLDDDTWRYSGGWVHRNELDFCPDCQEDGSMQASLDNGVLPLGRKAQAAHQQQMHDDMWDQFPPATEQPPTAPLGVQGSVVGDVLLGDDDEDDVCPVCNGEGFVETEESGSRCTHCMGTGYLND